MKLTLSRDLAEIDFIVASMRAFFTKYDLPDSLAAKVDLATEELFVNLIRHNPTCSASITLQMHIEGAGVGVQLVDMHTQHFDPREAPLVTTAATLDERVVGGLGLHLVSKVVDSIDYEYIHGRSIVSFIASTGSTDV